MSKNRQQGKDVYAEGFTPPSQHQDVQPGIEQQMHPRPEDEMKNYRTAGKLRDRKAVITGGDSGIGKAVAIAYAKEGADVAIIYLQEDQDARQVKSLVEKEGRRCLLYKGDIRDYQFCKKTVHAIADQFGRIDILVNNAAQQYPVEKPEELTPEQFENTFKVNVFGHFYMTRESLPHMQEGASILFSTSITAYEGHETLVDYSATKAAQVGLIRSLAQSLVDRKIRVNGVAPGPIWTPLIPASFTKEHVKSFGQSTPMKRPGQPDEVAPSYVFLASDENSYMTGQVLHVDGGRYAGS